MAHTHQDERSFPNQFPPYSEEAARQYFAVVDDQFKLSGEFKEKLYNTCNTLMTHWIAEITKDSDRDQSVYTGKMGNAMLYLHAAKNLHKQEYMNEGAKLINKACQNLGGSRHRVYTFLCGDGGPLALKAAVSHELGDKKACEQAVTSLTSLTRTVVDSGDIPDELLYGRTGYLYSLLYVRSLFASDIFGIDDNIDRVTNAILDSGQKLRGKFSLNYVWHDSEYLGAAHGWAGILFILMRTPNFDNDERAMTVVRATLDAMLTLRYSSGNFPSSIGSHTDKLVHWCHGAPGWIHTLLLAYQIFKGVGYLSAAKQCAEVIWQRGLLRKGYGLCHGVAGNAYGLLAYWKATRDPVYLYRACQFTEWMFQYGQHGCRVPDRPYSLFEGLAGTIYFMIDMLDPENAAFPAFY